ncbi:MAG TPA: TlpA disulfide reductase family protein [Solirubrobacterales bacterium]|jgi:thiol-disulfide isomerase/thioredoxin|nr:TlpA disulfide reductase family protein [Solirubrobacterales bacterium]
MRRRITLALALLASLAMTTFVVGCGSSSGGDTTHPNYGKALAGAPAPLARLYGEADKLLPGGKDAFEKRVAALGYPVVANVWASWCGPCRYEFPMFQEASAKWGKKVAFIGVDSEDSEGEAENWLAGHPVPYPSYYDPNFEVASSYKASGPPDTAFYNREGELVEVKRGQYAHASELEEDIKQYALGGA